MILEFRFEILVQIAIGIGILKDWNFKPLF